MPTAGPSSGQVPAPDTAVVGDGPEAVASKWTRAWCATNPRQAAGDNVRALRTLMTSDAYAAELRGVVSAESWARTQRAGLSTLCQGIRVETPSAAPRGLANQWVVITAEQITTDRTGALIGTQTITETRLVIHDSDSGRWLVDKEVQAG